MATKKTSKKTPAPKLKPIKVETVDSPFPSRDDPKHLFQVTLVVLADSHCSLEQVLNHVTAACLRHPFTLPVVNGYGTAVKNLTLTNRADRSQFRSQNGMICTEVVAKRVDPKKPVPIIQIAK